jgi:hypothetical protein
MGLFTKKSFVGIDLGTYALKAVQVEKSGNTWRVSHSASVPTPPDRRLRIASGTGLSRIRKRFRKQFARC